MDINIWAIVGSAFIPLIIGFIYYNPKVLGGAWMKATGLTEEKMQGANMPLIFWFKSFIKLFISFLFTHISYTSN